MTIIINNTSNIEGIVLMETIKAAISCIDSIHEDIKKIVELFKINNHIGVYVGPYRDSSVYKKPCFIIENPIYEKTAYDQLQCLKEYGIDFTDITDVANSGSERNQIDFDFLFLQKIINQRPDLYIKYVVESTTNRLIRFFESKRWTEEKNYLID